MTSAFEGSRQSVEQGWSYSRWVGRSPREREERKVKGKLRSGGRGAAVTDPAGITLPFELQVEMSRPKGKDVQMLIQVKQVFVKSSCGRQSLACRSLLGDGCVS